jgi:hypothetical protein
MINLNEALSIYIMESQVLHDKRNMLFTYDKNNCLSYSDDPVIFSATFGKINAIEINTINVIDKRKGIGTILLKSAIEYAKSIKKDIVLYASPMGEGMNEKQLIQWYKNNGFEEYDKSDYHWLIYRVK